MNAIANFVMVILGTIDKSGGTVTGYDVIIKDTNMTVSGIGIAG